MVQTHKLALQKRDALLERLTPRRCMIIPVGMILAGAGIPALMVLRMIPANLLLSFAGFALIAIGSVLALVRCGEI
jgi:O-antigen/teichoic acid export membrane protein